MDIGEFTSYGFESSVRKLFKRCVKCPDELPSCPVCAEGEYCTQLAQSCTQCMQRQCMRIDETTQATAVPTPKQDSGDDGPNVGAIVGGIVGGIAFIAIVTYLIWRFFIKDRREEYEEEYEEEPFEGYSGGQFTASNNPSLTHRQSTHTMRSVASTSFTRASNVIQIAFIPGVTDRSNSDEEYDAVPPVPPIPIATSQASSPHQTPYTDSPDHYFMPRDLRDSAYSGFSEDSRSSYNRQSHAPSITPSLLRQSVSSTLYRQSEVEPATAPAQTAQRGRANMVSVSRSESASPSLKNVPAVPEIDYGKYGLQQPIQPSSNRAASPAGSGGVVAAQQGSVLGAQPSAQSSGGKAEETDIAAAIWQATKQASKQPTHGGLGSVSSPFSDANQAPTP